MLPARPLRPILPSEREAYDRDGVVRLKGIFPSDWFEFLANAIENAMKSPGIHAEEYSRSGQGRFFGDLEMALRISEFRRFALESPAAEIAGRMMGASRVNFFYDQLLVKEPGTEERTPWHQDQPYWAVAGRQVCSLWLPIDPVAEDVSPEYISGSHLWPEFNPYHFADGTPYKDTGLPALPDIDAERGKYPIVRFALEPGDCLVFQAMIVHGSPGNKSRYRRRAVSTRWTGDDARYVRRRGEVAIPTEDPGLSDGDQLTCERFPLVWRSETAATGADEASENHIFKPHIVISRREWKQ
jgi:ectoine hydroxylase-related dioxygenase (phytanoyl-CoA dioxygenase family)